MVENLSKDGRKVLVFDASKDAIKKVVDASAAGNKSVSSASMEEIAQKCSVIFSMLPNDQVAIFVTSTILHHFICKVTFLLTIGGEQRD